MRARLICTDLTSICIQIKSTSSVGTRLWLRALQPTPVFLCRDEPCRRLHEHTFHLKKLASGSHRTRLMRTLVCMQLPENQSFLHLSLYASARTQLARVCSRSPQPVTCYLLKTVWEQREECRTFLLVFFKLAVSTPLGDSREQSQLAGKTFQTNPNTGTLPKARCWCC